MTGPRKAGGPGGDVMDCDAFRDEMMDLLYGEAAPAVARRLEDHQAGCRSCRDELASFRRLRRDLASWRTPPGLGRSPRRLFGRTYLAMAAGLVLLVMGGLSVRGSEVRYEQGRFALRLGRATDPAALSAALAAQQERHQREMEALRATITASRSDEDTLRKMQQMIAASEARQAALVATGLTRLEERTEARRQYDLAQVGAGLSYLDGKAGLQAARTTELMGHVLQASQKK